MRNLRPIALVICLGITGQPSRAGQSLELWSSAEELASVPVSGPAWSAVKNGADENTSNPDVSNQDDPTNVRVLAAAIVFARTGDSHYKDKVVSAIQTLVTRGYPGGRTLAWARETGAYALAADLVGCRTLEFEAWLRKMADVWIASDGRTLRVIFEHRPNNWGTHAFGSLCSIYAYLGDTQALAAIRAYWIQSVTGPKPALLHYGSDKSWHLDPNDPRMINPKGAMKEGFNIDGFFPDDMRRGGSFSIPPGYTGYVWEVQQGLIQAARVLERQGMAIWDVDQQALYRAAYALQVRLGNQDGAWKAAGDDLWMLAFLDRAYGTDWSGHQDVWGAGKNVGWPYVLLGDDATQPSAASPIWLNIDRLTPRMR
ncbi:hypothetical protein AMJ85_07500 [candidate division BRC1 bacterium SM23_51]|nr:MAG: hypothetical protein AMJ85_07500 [candidate division BRC1 bacterium SM23_51]